MGGAAQAVGAVAAAAEGGGGGAVEELTWVKPWRCPWPGCHEYSDKGTSQKYVNSHMDNHRETRDNEQKKRAERDAARAQKVLAAGASSQRKQNRMKDMRATQRAEAKRTTKGKGNGQGDGGTGTGKGGRKKSGRNAG